MRILKKIIIIYSLIYLYLLDHALARYIRQKETILTRFTSSNKMIFYVVRGKSYGCCSNSMNNMIVDEERHRKQLSRISTVSDCALTYNK